MDNSKSFDDIPDTIEIDGKIHPFDKEDYRKWAIEGGKRILAFVQNGPMRIKLGGELLSIWDPGEFITIDPDGNGTTIELKEHGLKIREGLIGLAGTYYQPHHLGADSNQQVIDSWNWLFTRSNFPKEKFEEFLEGLAIIRMITTGTNQVVLQHMMSLAIDLKELHDNGINTDEKISELMSKVKGNWRKFNKLMNGDEMAYASIQMNEMSLTIADMLAESVLAKIAYKLDLCVEMKKSPDLIIDDVLVEVKNDRQDETNSKRFESKVNKGLKQGGELVAIFTDTKKKSHKDKKITWWATESMSAALPMAIELCKKGRKCVLLFTGSSKGPFGRVGLIR